ncbi:hypothetical protein C8F01DRAFT_1338568 [Mycena amicta]|nr:hypothetical protein C8F01DRAFT_1338568 [Mycena amicta]
MPPLRAQVRSSLRNSFMFFPPYESLQRLSSVLIVIFPSPLSFEFRNKDKPTRRHPQRAAIRPLRGLPRHRMPRLLLRWLGDCLLDSRDEIIWASHLITLPVPVDDLRMPGNVFFGRLCGAGGGRRSVWSYAIHLGDLDQPPLFPLSHSLPVSRYLDIPSPFVVRVYERTVVSTCLYSCGGIPPAASTP